MFGHILIERKEEAGMAVTLTSSQPSHAIATRLMPSIHLGGSALSTFCINGIIMPPDYNTITNF
jgi:hypothetical protein